MPPKMQVQPLRSPEGDIPPPELSLFTPLLAEIVEGDLGNTDSQAGSSRLTSIASSQKPSFIGGQHSGLSLCDPPGEGERPGTSPTTPTYKEIKGAFDQQRHGAPKGALTPAHPGSRNSGKTEVPKTRER